MYGCYKHSAVHACGNWRVVGGATKGWAGALLSLGNCVCHDLCPPSEPCSGQRGEAAAGTQ